MSQNQSPLRTTSSPEAPPPRNSKKVSRPKTERRKLDFGTEPIVKLRVQKSPKKILSKREKRMLALVKKTAKRALKDIF
jgi:hypothetical protein